MSDFRKGYIAALDKWESMDDLKPTSQCIKIKLY